MGGLRTGLEQRLAHGECQDTAGRWVGCAVVCFVAVARTSYHQHALGVFFLFVYNSQILLVLSAVCGIFNKRDHFVSGTGRAGTG